MNIMVFCFDYEALKLIPIEHLSVLGGNGNKLTVMLRDVKTIRSNTFVQNNMLKDDGVELHFSDVIVHLNHKLYSTIAIQ